MIFEFMHPEETLVPNTTCDSVDRVLVHLRMETFLHLRRNFSNGIGN
jgi:hypothetical protein